MVWRVWSKFGKSRIRPLHAITMERPSTPAQNHTFSPPLKRPEEMCSFFTKKAHERRSHFQS